MGDLGEEAADLGVGIFAGLETAEELQDEAIVVEDGGVGLLGGAGTCGQGIGAAYGLEGGGACADDLGVLRFDGGVGVDHGEQRLAEVLAGGGVVEDRGAATGAEIGEDGGGAEARMASACSPEEMARGS